MIVGKERFFSQIDTKEWGDYMLAQDRFEKILDILKEKQSVTVSELTRQLNTSESTIRRDLTELHQKGLLMKVHGGATAVKSVLSREEAVISKSRKNLYEKRKIAEYAAGLIGPDDVVYIDAGTTTELMLDYLRERDVIYVTNGISHARKLMSAGYHVHLIGGEIKAVTEAIVGEEALEHLEKYNFTKGFFGVNGIDFERGLTTPDIKEAAVKKSAVKKCRAAYILADHSKFDEVSSIKFADLEEVSVITDHLINVQYKKLEKLKEVI